MDELPIDECRRLVAIRTGVIGYPDAHAIGVAQCSLRIAARLEVDDEVRRAVVHGALLHDVGKLRINERILSKPGPLTLEERLCVRQHPLEGERIVGDEVDRPVTEVVTAHHERWDGSGYPRGLRGEEIPLSASIFGVADTLDAITSDRPYRAALPFSAAREVIVRGSGRLFDPLVAEAFLTIPEEAWPGIGSEVANEWGDSGVVLSPPSPTLGSESHSPQEPQLSVSGLKNGYESREALWQL